VAKWGALDVLEIMTRLRAEIIRLSSREHIKQVNALALALGPPSCSEFLNTCSFNIIVSSILYALPAMPPKVKFPPLTKEQLDTIQGDIWSRGFPKYYETYYFFSIAPGEPNAKAFARCLRNLAMHQPELISTLRKVKEDHDDISSEKEEARAGSRKANTIPVANALIAFTSRGLQAVSSATSRLHH
jgi:hypothetical protein